MPLTAADCCCLPLLQAVLDEFKAESQRLRRENGTADLTYNTHKQHYTMAVNR